MADPSIPVFTAKRSKDFPGFLIVNCPRDDCPGTKAGRPFLVSEKEWMRPVRRYPVRGDKVIVVTGRSCPYCHKVGRLPSRRLLGA